MEKAFWPFAEDLPGNLKTVADGLNSRPKFTHLASAGLAHPGSADVTHPWSEGPELAALLGPPPLPRHMRSTVEPYAGVVEELVKAGLGVYHHDTV